MKFLLSFVALLALACAAFADEALAEVNAKRATRGLRPYVQDAALTQAAQACADFRAANLMFGHTSNDFAFLPPGARADSAGCAAYHASYGWLSCDIWEPHTYAGAAYAVGRDGKRYMHLFISNTPNGVAGNGIQLISNAVAPPTTVPAPMAAPAAPGACAQAPAGPQYRVEHRGLFGRRAVLVAVGPGACSPAPAFAGGCAAPAQFYSAQSASVGGCAGGSCSLPGRTTVRSHLTIRQR